MGKGTIIAPPILQPWYEMGVVITTTPWLLFFWERDPIFLVQEDVWTPEPVWRGVENLAPARV